MTKEQIESFEEAVKPLIKWMNERTDLINPHSKIIVETDRAELVSGEMSMRTTEFIKD